MTEIYQKLNHRTVQMLLGHHRWNTYKQRAEDTAQREIDFEACHFLVSRAESSRESMKDLGAINVVLYNEQFPSGFCVTMEDKGEAG